ncbi:hypothetical protein [Streptomyces sp. NRRL B-24572]|uniref:hypothetical protein n=1 Tax=Streptomyces sp. NRRL B-24572 TaxID=1962156 RepID=UPI0015C51BB8|nr:hypothetical protein [Streptomyces sp. NRRL B-24572]
MPITAALALVGLRRMVLVAGGVACVLGRLLGLLPLADSAGASFGGLGEGGQPGEVLRCVQPPRGFGRTALPVLLRHRGLLMDVDCGGLLRRGAVPREGRASRIAFRKARPTTRARSYRLDSLGGLPWVSALHPRWGQAKPAVYVSWPGAGGWRPGRVTVSWREWRARALSAM